MHRSESWDDLRHVLRVAREGSVSAAARSLGVNHATVLRRVAAVEARFGLNLFEKSLNGYKPAEAHAGVFEAIAEIETAVIGLARVVQGQKAPLSGIVRVTATDTFCHSVLPQIIQQLHSGSSQLRIELINSNHHVDLARMDAELSVRIGQSLSEDMEGDIVAELGFAAFTAPDYAGSQWVGLAGPLSRSVPAQWMADTLNPAQSVSAADSFLTVRELAAAGLGLAILPAFLGNSDSRLERRDVGLAPMQVPIWVAGHRDMLSVPRIRAARAFLGKALRARQDYLRGVPTRS